MIPPPLLSVCIPIYESWEILKQHAIQAQQILERQALDYELLLCNDDTTDRTQSILQSLAERSDRVRIFRNQENSGLGYSLRRMFQEANGTIVCYTDIDLSFQFERIGEFVELMGDADVVVGSRYAGIRATLPRTRRLASRLYLAICSALMEVPIKDLGSGMLLIRKSCLDQIRLCSTGFGIHVELHAKLSRVGCRYHEVPIRYDHWPSSSFRILRHALPTMRETIAVWTQMRRTRPNPLVRL